MGNMLESVIGALNGVVGDYLARTDNGLATTMGFYVDGRELVLERDMLARAFPAATRKLVIMLHGLACTERTWAFPDGTDYGSRLARDLGYTTFYLRYNSGLPIVDSGEAFAPLLERLCSAYPVAIDEIVLLGYSMGGLVARSACHIASESGMRWLSLVKDAVYVGTPHGGAPLERFGSRLVSVLRSLPDPYTQLVGQIVGLRSDGIKDLAQGTVARNPDLEDAHHPVAMLHSIRHYLVAGTISHDPVLTALFGDALVPVSSATQPPRPEADTGPLPKKHIRIFRGANHVELAHHEGVYGQIHAWLKETRS